MMYKNTNSIWKGFSDQKWQPCVLKAINLKNGFVIQCDSVKVEFSLTLIMM